MFQFVQPFLRPADGFCQGPRCPVWHDLNGPAFPVEEDASNPAGRADSWVVIGRGKAKVDLLSAGGAAEGGPVGQGRRKPGWPGLAHGKESLQGKCGNRCRHQVCTAGDKESQSTMRAGTVVSPSTKWYRRQLLSRMRRDRPTSGRGLSPPTRPPGQARRLVNVWLPRVYTKPLLHHLVLVVSWPPHGADRRAAPGAHRGMRATGRVDDPCNGAATGRSRKRPRLWADKRAACRHGVRPLRGARELRGRVAT